MLKKELPVLVVAAPLSFVLLALAERFGVKLIRTPPPPAKPEPKHNHAYCPACPNDHDDE